VARKRERLNDRLHGIDLKLGRAEQHLIDIQTRGLAWVSKDETWEFSREDNVRESRYVVSMRLVKPMPPVLPLMVDEVIHHLRSSLDHLASYLVEWSGGQEGRAAWPITRSSSQWTREVERRKGQWQIWRKKGGGPLAGATPAVKAFVEGKQPYKGTGKTRDHPLFELNDLWNVEKHRILNPIRVYATPTGSWENLFRVEPEIEPLYFSWVLKPGDELKFGTKRTFAVLDFPADHPPTKVEVKGNIPAQVVVGEGDGNRGGFEEDLGLIRGIVAEAVELFPPPKSAQ
jgi:hypothetical protein